MSSDVVKAFFQAEARAEAVTPRPRKGRRKLRPEKQKHKENKKYALIDIIRHDFYDTGSYHGTTAALLHGPKC